MSLISVIVTTYNWPKALAACLDSLLLQEDRDFEILVADDGSGPETLKTIQSYQNQAVPIAHIFQEDNGFQAAKIRNKAAAQSRGDYLLFIDGDCLLFPDFISRHRSLAEPHCFVPGNRILLSQTFTPKALNSSTAITQKGFLTLFSFYLRGRINRIMPLIRLPLGPIRKLQAQKWQKAMTCNLGVQRKDFFAVNGFDEVFAGWGYEDSDLIIRLIHHGARRKEGRFAVPVFHLWHRENDKSKEKENYQRLLQRLDDKNLIIAQQGVAQYM